VHRVHPRMLFAAAHTVHVPPLLSIKRPWFSQRLAGCRFALEVVKAVAAEIGAERTGIRLSPFGGFQNAIDSHPYALTTYLLEELNKWVVGARRHRTHALLLSLRWTQHGGVCLWVLPVTCAPCPAVAHHHQPLSNTQGSGLAYGKLCAVARCSPPCLVIATTNSEANSPRSSGGHSLCPAAHLASLCCANHCAG
jgi:hypothetical protein